MFLALAMVGILLPLGAAYVERGAKVLIAERHHRHHDTYTVPPELTNSLVKAMVVMGGVGVVLGVLCLTGVFWQRYVFVLAFFDAFVICLFAAWLALCRHQVALFEDHMVVTPLVGRCAPRHGLPQPPRGRGRGLRGNPARGHGH